MFQPGLRELRLDVGSHLSEGALLDVCGRLGGALLYLELRQCARALTQR